MKAKLIFGVVVLSAGLAACGNSASKDSTEKADSINYSRDSTNKDGPTTGHMRELSGDDSKFAVAAANGGLAEVELGKLAQEKATSQAVKDFGAMMVADHSKANEELKAVAEQYKVTLPAELNDEAQKLKNELRAKTGSDFDKAYVKAMVDDHENDIKEFERAQKVCKYPELRAFADKTLPTLKAHLAEVKKIDGQLK